MAVFTPALFRYVVSNLVSVVGFGTGTLARTIGEAQPPVNFVHGPFVAALIENISKALGYFYRSYGLAYIGAIVGAVVMLARLVLDWTGENRVGYVFVVFWFGFMTAATLTQARFNYYLIIPVAVLNAFLVGEVLRRLGASAVRTRLWELDGYQVLALATVVLVLVAPGSIPTASQVAAATTSPGLGIRGWDDSLDWLSKNTPDVGQYGGGDDEMQYYGTYERVEDFNYPDGAYGVLSWWDYGHWITVLGHRIPVANPFQDNVHMAANFLLATNESKATKRLPDDGAGVRYVMIDWMMADPGLGTKFFAPIVWYNANGTQLSYSDLRARVYNTEGRFLFIAPNQRFYESMMTRLYWYHGSAIQPKPVVLDYKRAIVKNGSLAVAVVPSGPNADPVKRFKNMTAAREFVKQEGSARIGGVGRYPMEYVPALEHYRLVHVSKRSAFTSPKFRSIARQRVTGTGLTHSELFPTAPAWVKTFERVPGATVIGTAPPNTTVVATVEMRVPNTNSTFTYTQRAKTGPDGTFTMTLPYSTTGYDQWGPATGIPMSACGQLVPTRSRRPQTVLRGGRPLTSVKRGSSARIPIQ